MSTIIATATDADRIAADGIPITLQGQRHYLRFAMRALRHLEREFGSIRRFVECLDQNEWGEDRIKAICAGMTAGLLHEKPAGMAADLFQEQIEDLLDDGNSLIEWMNSMTLALDQAFPPRKGSDGAPKVRGSRKSSPGAGTTFSPPSDTGAPTRRSGR